MTDVDTLVVGGGVTGLAVGARSDALVLEQVAGPGGICRSYYVRPDTTEVLDQAPEPDDAYRFEIGGGHWIFGGDPAVLAELEELAGFRRYERRAQVRLGAAGIVAPYPLQAHLDAFDAPTRARIEAELARAADNESDGTAPTLGAWLRRSVGPTLYAAFFGPFHDRYTAGLTDVIAPQDPYKTPTAGTRGYNASFAYPVGGLDALTRALAARADVRYDARVVGVDAERHRVTLADGTALRYGRIVSTLPLDVALRVAGLTVAEPADPYTSVLVLNLGGARGRNCPDCHWQYEPDADAGFHRLGFYSNVDRDFLPGDRRDTHVSMYVERAYPGGQPPTEAEAAAYARAVTAELVSRGYLTSVDVVHPSWVDAAYTWQRPGSGWREAAQQTLADAGITTVGRYGCWRFQGIAESIAEGFAAGEALGRST